MSGFKCNYQTKVSVGEFSEALSRASCERCGVTTAELIEKGELLEVCGEEYSSDPTNGERVLTALALCPSCHRKFHQDARGRHNPCQIKARLSREFLA